MLRIGLDMDQVLDDFIGPYLQRFGEPKKDSEITRNVQRILSKDKEFWLSLPVLNRIDFTPELYCSKRVNPKSWSKQWLRDNGYPDRPFYQMFYQHGNKATMIKGRVDVFVDDSVSNFVKMNRSGVPCLLLDNPSNRYAGPVLRIYSLQKDEITDVYRVAKEMGVFNNIHKLFNRNEIGY